MWHKQPVTVGACDDEGRSPRRYIASIASRGAIDRSSFPPYSVRPSGSTMIIGRKCRKENKWSTPPAGENSKYRSVRHKYIPYLHGSKLSSRTSTGHARILVCVCFDFRRRPEKKRKVHNLFGLRKAVSRTKWNSWPICCYVLFPFLLVSWLARRTHFANEL